MPPSTWKTKATNHHHQTTTLQKYMLLTTMVQLAEAQRGGPGTSPPLCRPSLGNTGPAPCKLPASRKPPLGPPQRRRPGLAPAVCRAPDGHGPRHPVCQVLSVNVLLEGHAHTQHSTTSLS